MRTNACFSREKSQHTNKREALADSENADGGCDGDRIGKVRLDDWRRSAARPVCCVQCVHV